MHERAVADVDAADAVVDCGRQRQVDDQQILVELRRPGQQFTVGGHDDRVAVEDQLVLAADHVDVGERGAGLGRAALREPQPDVVLVQLVRRAVDVDHQPDAGLRGRAATGPPSCQRSSQMVSATSTPQMRTTGSVSPGTK